MVDRGYEPPARVIWMVTMIDQRRYALITLGYKGVDTPW
jgi:hypothetical protein